MAIRATDLVRTRLIFANEHARADVRLWTIWGLERTILLWGPRTTSSTGSGLETLTDCARTELTVTGNLLHRWHRVNRHAERLAVDYRPGLILGLRVRAGRGSSDPDPACPTGAGAVQLAQAPA